MTSFYLKGGELLLVVGLHLGLQGLSLLHVRSCAAVCKGCSVGRSMYG